MRGRQLTPCVSEDNCPAMFELADGRIAVVGVVEVVALPDGVGVGPGEALVVIPRDVFDRAAAALSSDSFKVAHVPE